MKLEYKDSFLLYENIIICTSQNKKYLLNNALFFNKKLANFAKEKDRDNIKVQCLFADNNCRDVYYFISHGLINGISSHLDETNNIAYIIQKSTKTGKYLIRSIAFEKGIDAADFIEQLIRKANNTKLSCIELQMEI